MHEQNHTPTDPYQEGYTAGQAGMSNTYLPFKYLKDPTLSQQWEKGWHEGTLSAGLRPSPKTRILRALILLSILSLGAYYLIIDNNILNLSPLSSSDNHALDTTKQTIEETEPQTNAPTTATIATNNTHSTATSATTAENTTAQISAPPITTPAKTIATALKQEDIAISTPINIVTQIPVDNASLNIDTPAEKNTLQTTPSTDTTTTNENQPPEPMLEGSKTTASTTSLAAQINTQTSAQKQYEHDNLSEAMFSKSIINRNPVDILSTYASNLDTLFFFTKFERAIGKIITHTWYFEGTLITSTTFPEIQGNTWRLYSEQSIDKQKKGKWSIKVSDTAGTLYTQQSIIIE